MKEKNFVVVPVDFSEITDKLVEYAVYMANRLSAEIQFVNVVDLYAGDAMLGFAYMADLEETMVSNAKQKMADLVQDTKEKCKGCGGEILIGDPVEKIVDFARESRADLLIISTHGARGLEKILLGSVAERVLKRAHCPVLFVSPHRMKD